MAKMYFRYGAMNSGKSTALIQVAHNYEERGMRVYIIKPQIDSKGANKIVSRIGAWRTVDKLISSNDDIYKIVEVIQKRPDCVLVDEAQFLQPEQVDQLFHITTDLSIPVIAYGLRNDFQTNLFQGSKRLFELAHSLEELKTICRCGKKAMFNGRKINGRFVFRGDQVAIDGEKHVEYESLCGVCYLKELATE
jgi:thymidine kinase